MPVSQFLRDKWDERLYNWSLWMAAGGGSGRSEGISSIYDPALWQRGSGYRSPGSGMLSGLAQDTDRLMVAIQSDEARAGTTPIYDALCTWAKNEGSRGAQAASLSIHQDTYRDRVDSGMRWLERLDRASRARTKPAHG